MLKEAHIRLSLFYLICLGFIGLNLWFMLSKELNYLNLLPLVFFMVLLVVYSFDKILFLIAFLAPLSVPLIEYMPQLGIDMYLPTEPLLFGLLLIFLLKLLSEKSFGRNLLSHPVSLAIYFNLIWLLITSISSTMPTISFKYLLMRIWFVAGLYFLTAKLFEKGQHMEKYVWLYVSGLIMVVFYSTSRHLAYGLWDKDAAHFVVSPFYRDHTSYGAATAFFLPFLVLFSFRKQRTKKLRWLSFAALCIVLTGFVLSYSRAAWLSIAGALMVWGLIKLRIRFKTLLVGFLGVTAILFLFQNQLLMQLHRNSEESSADIGTHISSISNISTDASNLERINRWSCALAMFAEKPLLGFGPGTYMFNYAPYQLSKQRTIISTNSADGGNAHSEYLGALSESGLVGLLSYFLIITLVFYTGIKTYTRLVDHRLRGILLAALIGLVSYYIHGFLNNFLDTDKISVPFWGFTAMIVVIDLISRKQFPDSISKEKSEITN